MAGCLLAAGLSATLVHADWSVPPKKNYSRQGFGDFPPKDIDKLIEEENQKAAGLRAESSAKDNSTVTSQPPAGNTAATTGSNQPQAVQNYPVQNPPVQNYPVQNPPVQNYYYPVPNYGGYYAPRGGTPWNNRGSGFTMPWGNNGSSFTGPWNNRGSGFTMPWGNNGSGFTMPWVNNSSSNTAHKKDSTDKR